jgi:hypothetical protein
MGLSERRSQMLSFVEASGDRSLEKISDLAVRRMIKQRLLIF